MESPPSGGDAPGGELHDASAAVEPDSTPRPPPWDLLSTGARQLILIVSPSWSASRGRLYLLAYEGLDDDYPDETNAANMGWISYGIDIPVALGKNGLAWGRGLHPAQDGPQKKEGDGRSVAGVFRLGPAWIAHELDTKWRTAPLEKHTVCVDDIASPRYNSVVTKRNAADRSVEQLGADGRSFWLFVEHNTQPQPQAGAGSCISVQSSEHSKLLATTGSIEIGPSLGEDAFGGYLLSWLDPDKRPILVQLPEPVLAHIGWDHLPRLPGPISEAMLDDFDCEQSELLTFHENGTFETYCDTTDCGAFADPTGAEVEEPVRRRGKWRFAPEAAKVAPHLQIRDRTSQDWRGICLDFAQNMWTYSDDYCPFRGR